MYIFRRVFYIPAQQTTSGAEVPQRHSFTVTSLGKQPVAIGHEYFADPHKMPCVFFGMIQSLSKGI